MSEKILNVAEICNSTKALGPGNRFVIWVQGCPFNCKNCTAPDWIPKKEANIISINKLGNHILSRPNINGITISGGEPILQSEGINQLLSLVLDEKPELNIILFTGYNFEDLTDAVHIELLKKIDIVISGKYIEKLNNSVGLRGSSNQKINFTSDRLKEFEEELLYGERKIETHIQPSQTLVVGIKSKNFKF